MENLRLNTPEPEERKPAPAEQETTDELEVPLWRIALQRFRRRWTPVHRRLDRFRDWAEPDSGEELETGLRPKTGLVPLVALFALALAAQYVQFSLPVVGDFLQRHDISARPAWMIFLILKQWALFVLMLLVLAAKEQRLGDIGFPRLEGLRWVVAAALLVLTLGAAVLHRPTLTPVEAQVNWLLPLYPLERVLSVLTALTAAVVEESFFRGFAIVWMYRWSGHLGLAVLFPAFVFGAGHSYLSWENVPFAFAMALVFSGLFLWKRDLYWPMVLHFALNNLDLFTA